MDHLNAHESNFTDNISLMENQDATTSPQSYNLSSYVSRNLRSRRIRRQLNRSNIYTLNRIRRLPLQSSNNALVNQFFNRASFV